MIESDPIKAAAASAVEVRRMESDADILATFEVMKQLRPNLERSEYVPLVRGMMADHGFRLAAVLKDGQVLAVAGYRISRSLSSGKHIYVNDLVTHTEARSKGYGKMLLEWAGNLGKENGCGHLQLDSGTQRTAAHRFYLRERLDIVAFHFTKKLA